MPHDAHELKFLATPEKGEVSALLVRPEDATHLLVLGHGASTNMRHATLQAIAERLAEVGIATFRYNFPYSENGKGRDGQAVCTATVRSAVAAAHEAAPDLPLLAGGHSFGGRMTSTAASESPIEGVVGLVFFSFPLHLAGKPETKRADHLDAVTVPMLFLSGTRDELAALELLRPVCEKLGERATLHLLDTADHGYKVLKKSRTSDGGRLRRDGSRRAGLGGEAGLRRTRRWTSRRRRYARRFIGMSVSCALPGGDRHRRRVRPRARRPRGVRQHLPADRHADEPPGDDRLGLAADALAGRAGPELVRAARGPRPRHGLPPALLLLPVGGRIDKEGRHDPLAFGDARTSPIDTRDVAKVIAAVLEHPEAHVGKVIELTGPKSQDMRAVAAEYSEALGRTITYVDVPMDEWRERELPARGLPGHVAGHMKVMAQLHADNRYDRLTHDFETIIGRPPTSIRDYVANHPELFGPSEPARGPA